MYLQETSGREKRQTLLSAIAIAMAVFVIGAPVVEAAISRVKLAGGTATAKVKDSGGGTIESEAIPAMGLTDAPGTTGAVAVRNFAGGGGFLGAGDCTASTDPAQGPLPNTVTLGGGNIVTGIIITGTGTVRITTQAVGQGQVPLANFVVNAQHPNEFVGLGNGLSVTTPLTFTGIDGSACNFVILGQGPGVGG
jgi:hypothetical protein